MVCVEECRWPFLGINRLAMETWTCVSKAMEAAPTSSINLSHSDFDASVAFFSCSLAVLERSNARSLTR